MSTWQDDEELLSSLREATGHADLESIRKQLQDSVAGNYEILDTVGHGACGVVFKARDVHLNRLVAIKAPMNPYQRRRLTAIFDEARIMAKVNHPNVASIYALSQDTDPPFMVTEFVDGVRIDEAVMQLPLGKKIDVFKGVLRGVAELHRRGIVHRDLKPSNILVDRDGIAKVLDMGIAEQMPEQRFPRSSASTTQGTPAYMAPEQSLGQAPRPSADVFSLGIILFELLTGQRPFQGACAEEVVRAIRESDPPLPRALKADLPGPLQAICLTALEKDPDRRYPSARHFFLDIERFVNGEAVTADPTQLADILEHGIDRHLNDLSQWRKDRLVSTREHDYFVDKYERLRQREEFWVLDSRRISFSQVVLHLGAWACVVSTFLMLCFRWTGLSKLARISLPLCVFAALLSFGLFLWSRRNKRVAMVLLMAASLTWPIFAATTFVTMEWGLMESPGEDMLPPGLMTNIELLITAGTWLILNLVFWYRTKTSAFSLIWGISAVVLATAIFTFTGMRQQLEDGNFDTVAGWYLIPGVAMFILALLFDLRWRLTHLGAPLYVISFGLSLIVLTYIAICGPTTEWLGLVDLTNENGEVFERHVKYSFMMNGLLYFILGFLADRSKRSRWLRRLAVILFWVTTSHILVPILLLEDEWAVLPAGWTVPELLLPIGALCFIFASVPKQMKSFFFSGLFYVAVSVQRLTARHFEDVFAWPVALAVAGLMLALVAWRRPAMFDKTSKKRGLNHPKRQQKTRS
ncbi:MAG: protein kinase [Phycisphaerae bacterium]|nr:protein kinase [Phycisphaerae bacterium]